MIVFNTNNASLSASRAAAGGAGGASAAAAAGAKRAIALHGVAAGYGVAHLYILRSAARAGAGGADASACPAAGRASLRAGIEHLAQAGNRLGGYGKPRSAGIGGIYDRIGLAGDAAPVGGEIDNSIQQVHEDIARYIKAAVDVFRGCAAQRGFPDHNIAVVALAGDDLTVYPCCQSLQMLVKQAFNAQVLQNLNNGIIRALRLVRVCVGVVIRFGQLAVYVYLMMEYPFVIFKGILRFFFLRLCRSTIGIGA